MKSELETEHKKDTELFEKMGCWSEGSRETGRRKMKKDWASES